MPSTSKSQVHLMRAALHGASFPKAKQLRKTMTMKSLLDYASTPEKGLPRKVKRG